MMVGKPVCVDDMRDIALQRLSKPIGEFLALGAGDNDLVEHNKRAFKGWYIIPRLMRDVSGTDLTTSVLGHTVQIPIGVAPLGLQKMVNPDGECATARAVECMGTVFSLSTVATSSIEDVASAAPRGLKWMQIYPYKDRNIERQQIKRAEAAGYAAILLTVDATVAGNRISDARNNFSVPKHLRFANFQDLDQKFKDNFNVSGTVPLMEDFTKEMLELDLSWERIKQLKSITHLPIVVKGILSGEDAELCVRYGADAIMVSNHGGRQLDSAPPAIEALPEIVAAVAGRCEVYVDGGVSQGADVFKALALGARMVFVGRSMLWGLVYDGEAGVRHALELLTQELKLNMLLAGCKRIADIKPSFVRRVESYSRL